MVAKAQVKELVERGPAAIEQELLDHANGKVVFESKADDKQAESAPAQVEPAIPDVHQEALMLRQLLFLPASPRPANEALSLASRSEAAKPRRSSRNGSSHGRRRRRGARS